jgi:nucleoside-diphosphate-sugar epimerase
MESKKKVLIVGAGSYIGTSFYNASKEMFDVTIIDAQKPLSIEQYRGFDSVLHVAGIAHVSKKKSMKDLYYRVNRDLAIQSAQLAKEAGVKQFIFMSSMIVYGGDYRVGKPKIITSATVPDPADFYGDSKLQADLAIQKMASSSFRTVVIRTPMVYGVGCKGNFPRLQKLAQRLYFLPKIQNQRTAIEINNLVAFFQKYIEHESCGVFFPRDPLPFCTFDVMLNARMAAKKKTKPTRLMNPLIYFCSTFVGPLRKMYGTKIYSNDLPEE